MNRGEVLIDISRSLDGSLPVWPGDRPFRMTSVRQRSSQDVITTGAVATGLHVGSHVDAPRHICEMAASVAELDPGIFVGPAVVAAVPQAGLITGEVVRGILREWPSPERILFRTGAWVSAAVFPTTFPTLTIDAVGALLAAGVRLVGTDAPSVDPFASVELPAHERLLTSGVPILENLLLDGVPEGHYELIALPLKIVGGDASPVRAVLRSA